MLAGSMAMFAYSGSGSLTKDSLIDPRTWLYGLMQIISSILLMILFTITTSTEGSLLSRFSIIFAFLFSLIFLNRKPQAIDLIAIAIVFASISIILSGLPSDIFKVSLILMVFASLTQAIRSFMAELHKANNTAKTVKDEVRVTSVVLFLTSSSFLMLNFIIALIKGYLPEHTQFLSIMPSLNDFAVKETLYMSAIVGVVVVGGMKYMEFVSVKIIKSEMFLLIAAIVPAITFGFENVASTFTSMSVSEISENDIYAGLLLITGSVLTGIFKLIKRKQPNL